MERDFEALEREEEEETERRRRISGNTRQGDLQEEGNRGGVETNNNQLVWIDYVKSSFLETYIQMGFYDWRN